MCNLITKLTSVSILLGQRQWFAFGPVQPCPCSTDCRFLVLFRIYFFFPSLRMWTSKWQGSQISKRESQISWYLGGEAIAIDFAPLGLHSGRFCCPWGRLLLHGVFRRMLSTQSLQSCCPRHSLACILWLLAARLALRLCKAQGQVLLCLAVQGLGGNHT